jgi:hypothetical protein
MLGIAVALLGAVARPRLDPHHGFVRWARRSEQDLLDDSTAAAWPARLAARTRQLIWVSHVLLSEYTLVRRAFPLIIAGLVLAGIAAAIATWGGETTASDGRERRASTAPTLCAGASYLAGHGVE